jgi:hypothetical protein
VPKYSRSTGVGFLAAASIGSANPSLSSAINVRQHAERTRFTHCLRKWIDHAKRNTAHCEIVRQCEPGGTSSDDKNIPARSTRHT